MFSVQYSSRVFSSYVTFIRCCSFFKRQGNRFSFLMNLSGNHWTWNSPALCHQIVVSVGVQYNQIKVNSSPFTLLLWCALLASGLCVLCHRHPSIQRMCRTTLTKYTSLGIDDPIDVHSWHFTEIKPSPLFKRLWNLTIFCLFSKLYNRWVLCLSFCSISIMRFHITRRTDQWLPIYTQPGMCILLKILRL